MISENNWTLMVSERYYPAYSYTLYTIYILHTMNMVNIAYVSVSIIWYFATGWGRSFNANVVIENKIAEVLKCHRLIINLATKGNFIKYAIVGVNFIIRFDLFVVSILIRVIWIKWFAFIVWPRTFEEIYILDVGFRNWFYWFG